MSPYFKNLQRVIYVDSHQAWQETYHGGNGPVAKFYVEPYHTWWGARRWSMLLDVYEPEVYGHKMTYAESKKFKTRDEAVRRAREALLNGR